MLKRCIRIVFLFLGIVLLLALCAGTALWIRYEQVRKSGEKVQLLSSPGLPETKQDLPAGERIPFKVLFSVPWGTIPLGISAVPSEGSQLSSEPFFTKIRTGWGRDVWQGTVTIQSCRAGHIAAAPGEASFSGGQVLQFSIPPFEAGSLPVQGTDLLLAGPIDIRKDFISGPGKAWKLALWVLIALATAGILVLALVYFFLRKKEKIIPPWEKALRALQELLEKVNDNQITPDRSIAKLCDILREYLEKRFALRASRQTTGEFLTSLEQDQDSLLTAEQHLFLQEFLCTADMVKFAKQSAAPEQIRLLASRGEALIRDTIPGKTSDDTGKEKK